MSKHRVGIEALAVALPERYVELEDLAKARGVDPAKYTTGLGGKQMAVTDPGEDSVALAANAVGALLRATGQDPGQLGMLAVGTESGVDHAKPVASYVHGLHGLPRAMRTFDIQHACYGGTAGLMAAAEWIASGAAAGRKALVVCADVARYELLGPGEPTQGGAAVALLVSDTPDLLALDLGISGAATQHVHDFWRPSGRREALVDGHYSVKCYLEALGEAYRGWRQRALERELVRPGPTLPSEQLARLLFHVPFCKMAKKAYAHLRQVDLELAAGAPLSAEALAKESAALEAKLAGQVGSSLWLNARVGNAYTASLYLALAGLLETEASALAGQRLGLFSYGSGYCSELFSGVVGERAAARIAAAGLEELLARRERVDVAEYERLYRLAADAPEARAPRPGMFRFTGIDSEGRRQYAAG